MRMALIHEESKMRMYQLLIIIFTLSLLWCAPAIAQNMTMYSPDIAFNCYDNGKPKEGCRINCYNRAVSGPIEDLIRAMNPAVRVEMFFSKKAGKNVEGRWWMFIKTHDLTHKVYLVDHYFLGPNVFCELPSENFGHGTLEWKIDRFKWGR